jgi:Tfp pilus assembly protein PilF
MNVARSPARIGPPTPRRGTVIRSRHPVRSAVPVLPAPLALAAVVALAPLVAPAPAFADRVVRVTVAADEEYRRQPDWRDRADRALAGAGEGFAGYGLAFEAVEYVGWESDAPDHDVAALQNELSAEVTAARGELIVGFAGAVAPRNNRLFVRLGHSDTPGRHLLISDRAGRDLDLVLRHELGHAFGLPHVSHTRSVMNEGVEGDRTGFDSLSGAILRNNARLDFLAGDPLAGCNLGALWALYETVARNGDDAADLIAIIGDSYRRRGDAESAERAYRAAQSMDGGLVSARLGLAMLALADGRPSESVTLLEKVRAEGGTIPGLETSLGLAYSQLGLTSSATRAYEAAIRQDPNDAAALNNLGLLLMSDGRDGDAERCLRRAVSVRPRFAEAWNNYGTLLQKQGRLDEAVDAFETSLMAGESAVAHRNLAGCLLQQHRGAEARRHLEASLRLDPDQNDADSLRRLADRR